MSTVDQKAISNLKQAAADGKLVVVVGTGVSMALTDGKVTALSWKGLIQDGFRYGISKGKITKAQSETWENQLKSEDMDDLLGAAEFMGRKLGAPKGDLYARWLKEAFENVEAKDNEMTRAVQSLAASGIPLCTLNYDTLLERVTGLPTITLQEVSKVGDWMRREREGILHLHGSWDVPASCVLGIRDYETTMGDDVRDLIQRALGSFSRLLFIGCSGTFADPNFSALIGWMREKMGAAALQHYALVRDDEAPLRSLDPAWQGFVDPVSYGPDRNDLPKFMVEHFQSMPSSTGKLSRRTSAPSQTKVLEDYLAFLLKDCGQMTIEGLRADMDTAQRRFDLERLFVPLKVLPTPPDFPLSDPNRLEKLQAWQEKNKTPLAFGEVFQKHQRLALLALPGGGKSILLKRLAVAYADPARRENSDDKLPSIELMPVLIRCREWRDYIRRPLVTMLASIDAITGIPSLSNFSNALEPLLRAGRVLLLVDGLDEIHNDADRAIFVRNLESFLQDYKAVRLVVTSREAGFSLVAPSLARFCERWRIAPLDESAIATLCDYWHRLMKGDLPKSMDESRELVARILKNNSLARLSENPLMLTMLLVVKHGAGGLPPDRVSLYERAVEVLLDTWNIEGHEPLNVKEAVPQLAYVALQLMRQGKQTLTERELLAHLEEARDKISQIRRYAKDTPGQFLKRVELRSSLLIEAGHQLDGARLVPFYQFRHLTFQEYLAAVAIIEGHYAEYKRPDTVLTPLASYLNVAEWKEVIPMVAVLAKKQAEPLISALVKDATSSKEYRDQDFLGRSAELPSIVRLRQSLLEEAQASPETLTSAFRVLAISAAFADASQIEGLAQGPYGAELVHQAWLLYQPMTWNGNSLLRYTLARLWMYQHPISFWKTDEGKSKLTNLLRSKMAKEVALGLLSVSFLQWGELERPEIEGIEIPIDLVDDHLFGDDHCLRHAAIWASALIYRRQASLNPSVRALDRLLYIWLHRAELEQGHPLVAFALEQALGRGREIWKPKLTTDEKTAVRKCLLNPTSPDNEAALTIAFYSNEIVPEQRLSKLLEKAPPMPSADRQGSNRKAALVQMGAKGRAPAKRKGSDAKT